MLHCDDMELHGDALFDIYRAGGSLDNICAAEEICCHCLCAYASEHTRVFPHDSATGFIMGFLIARRIGTTTVVTGDTGE